MSVKATQRLQWTFAAILCGCTLVALWSTAMSVRERKLAARRGERIQGADPVRLTGGDGRPMRIPLRRGQKLAVEHFSLLYQDESLSVVGHVEFLNLKKGEQRGYQELRLTVLEVDPTEVVVEAEIRPGASSYGDGRYEIRPGLQVEFDRKRFVTVTAWDPAKPEVKVKVLQG